LNHQQVALFPFRIESFVVESGLLGSSWIIERDGYGIVVSLPSRQADFGVAPPEHEALFRHHAWIDNKPVETAIWIFQVAVWVESEATPDLYPPDHPEGLDGEKVMGEAALVAISVAEDFVAWLRVRGRQYWLGPDESISNAGTADLIDLDSGSRIRNINWAYHTYLSNVGPPAGAETLDAIIDLLGQGKTPDEADLLLADARQTMSRAGNGTSLTGQALPFDRRRVVLLSAIAGRGEDQTGDEAEDADRPPRAPRCSPQQLPGGRCRHRPAAA
jgi:hypothetical protein